MWKPTNIDSQRPLLRLTDVGKVYPLMDTGRHKLSALWSLLRGQAVRHHYSALSEVNLEVNKGQSLGIVGVNGAGKSTLLKIIAGVVRPSRGTLDVQGRIGALLELGAGFHQEYTGRQNVYLACALMGLNKAETDDRLDAILAFADIGEHIDQPIKHYSSGMVVRLGFAVATVMRPDLLITDEVLAVGDESFQKKCSAWMQTYLDEGGTLLLCSHSMYHIQKLCTHAAWIHGGRVHRLGDSQSVTREYLAWHDEQAAVQKRTAGTKSTGASIYHVESLSLNASTEAHVTVGMQETLTLKVLMHSPDGRAPVLATSIVKVDGAAVFGTFSDMVDYQPLQTGPHSFVYKLEYPDVPLLPGIYKVRAHAMDPEGLRLMDHVEIALEVKASSRHMGVCLLKHKWLEPDEDFSSYEVNTQGDDGAR